MAKKELLQFLKSKKSIKDLMVLDYEQKVFELNQKATKARLESLSSRTHLLNQHIDQLCILINYFEDSQRYLEESIDKKSKIIISSYDEKCNNEFSKLIKKYNYANIFDAKHDAVQLIMDEMFLNFTGRAPKFDVMTIQHDRLKCILETKGKELLMRAESDIDSLINESFKEKWDWFFRNIKNIKKSYNQGSDYARNMAGGTCWENSCEREARFLKSIHERKNLSKILEQIEMGSSDEGRVNRARLNLNDQKAINGTYNKFNLKDPLIKDVKVPLKGLKGSSVIEELFNKKMLDVYHRNSSFLFYLNNTKNSSSGGHVINLVFDPSLKLYGFIDDNLGSCIYSSEQEFKKEFSDYINVIYPDYDKFRIGVCELLKA